MCKGDELLCRREKLPCRTALRPFCRPNRPVGTTHRAVAAPTDLLPGPTDLFLGLKGSRSTLLVSTWSQQGFISSQQGCNSGRQVYWTRPTGAWRKRSHRSKGAGLAPGGELPAPAWHGLLSGAVGGRLASAPHAMSPERPTVKAPTFLRSFRCVRADVSSRRRLEEARCWSARDSRTACTLLA